MIYKKITEHFKQMKILINYNRYNINVLTLGYKFNKNVNPKRLRT